jgi:ATP-dependent DNA helicase RecQ
LPGISEILKQYWGYDSFRPLQEDIINSVLLGNDTLALMPTGGGKSVCYQVPALCKQGLCLVISPLIALMKDQVENLRNKGITAFAVYSGMNRKEVENIFKVAGNSNCKFLYVSPERLETALFKEYLPSFGINLIAVDEAHCISQWGYDFRPPYLRIAALREELRGVPVLALTATATPDVQNDICLRLTSPSTYSHTGGGQSPVTDVTLKNWNVFRQSFERSNLSFSVFKVDSRAKKIIEIFSKVPGSGIVYCKSRKRTKEIADLLKMQKIAADFYHAGLGQEERSKKQEAWVKNETRVIVCTNAFGMGIDKPDVRIVVHADMPDCMENYYQEAGRAGRDLKKSYAVLLYDESDIAELEKMAVIRFPSVEDIRVVYQSVCNYLQIPSGGSEGVYFDFDINDFIKKFKLNVHTVVYALRALEQEGWLSFNEQVFVPSTVRFTANKTELYEFEKNNPALEPAIKSLLRAYEGIYDFPVSVSERVLAKLNKADIATIKQDLQKLNRAGIIEYIPQKDSPQVLMLKERVKAEDLLVDTTALRTRKEKFIYRSRMMIQYAQETAFCRSRLLGAYFGDNDLKNCGVCDNCLRQKALVISKEDFTRIAAVIQSLLTAQPLPVKDLLLQLGNVKKEKIWKILDLLQAENKIELDASGWVRLK